MKPGRRWTALALEIINRGKPTAYLLGEQSMPCFEHRKGVVAKLRNGEIALAATGEAAAVQEIWSDASSAVHVQFERRRPR